MRITIARTAGFCWGVRRTVTKVFDTADGATRPVATLGPVIHNPQVVSKLEEAGVRKFERVEEVPDGTLLVLRTHGAVVPEQELARARGLEVVDGTCPYVKFPQVMVQRMSRDGYHVIVLGDAKHAEVKGVASYAEGPVTIVPAGATIPDLPGVKKVAIVSQTTNDKKHLQAIVAEAVVRFREVKTVNTICYDTAERQTEVRELCAKVEAVVVVGGRASANTRHLAEIASELLPAGRVHHVERADELDPAWFAGLSEIGVSAGASTPDDVIDEVATRLATFSVGPAERRYHQPSFEPTHPNR